jgi:Xaa-Pro dipeptidase
MANPQEVTEKKRRVRELMTKLDLDAIVLKRQSNYSWLTCGGMNLVGIATEMGAVSLVLTHDAEYAICNNIEAPRVEKEEKLEEQGYQIRTFEWYGDQERKIVADIARRGKAGSDCGLPGTIDISNDFNHLRYSLTPWEVERYRELGHLTSKAIEEITAAIEPGDRECAIVGRLVAKLWENRIDYITTFCAADERISAFRHPLATEKEVKKRAMLCVNSRKWGLIVSITRFAQFGKVSSDLDRLYKANVYIDCVLMANTLPGRSVAEVFRKGVEAYAEMGYPEEYKLHHQGGAIGYVGRDYRANFESKEVVQENQAFVWNPSITGSKSEDLMLATTRGPVLLSKPVTFPTLEMKVGGYVFQRPAILEK